MSEKNLKKQITYGFHQIASNKNEDRGTMVLFHSAEDVSHIASFGVFDGHFGTLAASVCAQHLHKTILKRFKKYSGMKPKLPTELTLQQQQDAIFCESARLTYEEVDEGIRERDKSGCTGISIFLIRDIDDDSVRLYCSNVGDSRCVLFTTFINGMDSDKDSRVVSQAGSGEEDIIRDVFYGSDMDKIVTSRMTYAFPMNEDHKLTLPRERYRVESQSSFPWRPLPSNIVKAQMILNNALDESLTRGFTSSGSLIETGCPEEYLLDAASTFMQSLTTKDPSSVKPKRLVYETAKEADLISVEGEAFQRIHKKSFIGRRKLANGEEKGPEALFGIYNFSTNMTRSIGDRYGPRSCIAVPDISAVTIRKNEYVRLVIASDGVWDVLKNSEIRDSIFYDSHPEDAAVAIVNKAHAERLHRNMRMDDITAIVVDINAELFPKRNFASLLKSVKISSTKKPGESSMHGSSQHGSQHGSHKGAATPKEKAFVGDSPPVIEHNAGCGCVIV